VVPLHHVTAISLIPAATLSRGAADVDNTPYAATLLFPEIYNVAR
jgi:hypothetical protein